MAKARAVLAGILLAACPVALALNPSLDVSQYGHFSWKYRDGFAKGYILDMARPPTEISGWVHLPVCGDSMA